MRVILRTILILSSLALGACASKFVFQSDPPDARVFVSHGSKGQIVELGKTPVEIDQKEMLKKLDLGSSSVDFVEVSFEKQDHLPKKVLVPTGGFGGTETYIKTKLEPGKAESRVAQRLVEYLSQSQAFATKGDFTRAHQSVDEALKLDSGFSRALSMKASLYYLQQNFAESLSWFEKALASDPQYEEASKMIVHLRQKANAEPLRLPASTVESK